MAPPIAFQRCAERAWPPRLQEVRQEKAEVEQQIEQLASEAAGESAAGTFMPAHALLLDGAAGACRWGHCGALWAARRATQG